MKGTTELALGAILLFLVYDKPTALTEFSNSVLGKVLLILGVGFIAKTRGLAAGLVAALIMVVLMHNSKEGMTNKPKCEVKTGDKPQECKDVTDCGVAIPMCLDSDGKQISAGDGNTSKGTCSVSIDPKFQTLETNAAKDVETFDIRLREGFENMRCRERTIAAMQQGNGHTNNREGFASFM